MNERATYELIIAGKLEQLQAPEMIDAIWAKIELQLDLDMPTGDGGGGNTPASPVRPGKWLNTGFIIAAVAILLTFYFYNSNKTNSNPSSAPSITNPQQTPPTEEEVNNHSPGDSTPVNPVRSNNSTTVPLRNTTADTVTGVPSVINNPEIRDTPALVLPTEKNNPLVSPPANNRVDTVKKQRGVKGINENDYRIVPKKDTAKKNG
jgi:hypothetical protein